MGLTTLRVGIKHGSSCTNPSLRSSTFSGMVEFHCFLKNRTLNQIYNMDAGARFTEMLAKPQARKLC